MKRADTDNFLLESNRVLRGEKEKHLHPQHVISMSSGFSRCPQVQTGVWRGELRCRARLGSVQTPGGEEGKVNREKKILPHWRVLTKVSSPMPLGNYLPTIRPPLLLLLFQIWKDQMRGECSPI